jgi:hypothetical protein
VATSRDAVERVADRVVTERGGHRQKVHDPGRLVRRLARRSPVDVEYVWVYPRS